MKLNLQILSKLIDRKTTGILLVSIVLCSALGIAVTGAERVVPLSTSSAQPIPTMLSIRGLSPAYCDEQIKISGNLQVRGNLTALSSKTVKLEFSKDGSGWFGVHYVMTGSGGYYETSSTFGPGNWKARATFEGDATYGPCTNTLNFQVLGSWTKISLSASSSSVKVGERFTLNGK